jgi:hypothetical protein
MKKEEDSYDNLECLFINIRDTSYILSSVKEQPITKSQWGLSF